MKSDPCQSEAPVWKRRLRLQLTFFILCALLVAGSLATFFFKDLLKVTIEVPQYIDNLFNKNVVVAIIGTIGAPAIVAGPLLGITEQRVFGERIGSLTNWAYPLLFKFYFTVFIFAAWLGIYEGSVESRKVPIVLVFLAILLGTVFMLRVCYIFLISGEARERLALTYYAEQLDLYQKKKPNPEDARSHLLQSRQLMLKLAGALARRESEGRNLWAKNIWALWVRCAKQCEAAQKELKSLHPEEDLTDYCCLLAREFWETLSQKSEKPFQRLELLTEMLFTRSARENIRLQEDVRVEHYLIAGMLFTDEFQHAGFDRTWLTAYQILCDLYLYKSQWTENGRIAFKEFFWGLVWIMAVHSAYVDPVSFKAMRELYYRAEMEDASSSEQDEIRSFLEMFRSFYLRNTKFRDGIHLRKDQKVLYETRMLEFLSPYLKNPEDILKINLEDNLEIARIMLLEERM